MSVGNSNKFSEGIFFCTFTCYNWLPLIQMTNTYNNIYDSFKKWKEKNCHILGYVIMPNHVHFLIYIGDIEQNIGKLVANAKRFLAYEIVKILDDQNQFELLGKMSAAVPLHQQLKNKQHQVFERSFDCKPCFTDKTIEQKLQYMHGNPVTKKWSRIDDYRDYPHSSAGFYEYGKQWNVLLRVAF
jgi:REP element-mobilizing transposase RayT